MGASRGAGREGGKEGGRARPLGAGGGGSPEGVVVGPQQPAAQLLAVGAVFTCWAPALLQPLLLTRCVWACSGGSGSPGGTGTLLAALPGFVGLVGNPLLVINPESDQF